MRIEDYQSKSFRSIQSYTDYRYCATKIENPSNILTRNEFKKLWMYLVGFDARKQSLYENIDIRSIERIIKKARAKYSVEPLNKRFFYSPLANEAQLPMPENVSELNKPQVPSYTSNLKSPSERLEQDLSFIPEKGYSIKDFDKVELPVVNLLAANQKRIIKRSKKGTK